MIASFEGLSLVSYTCPVCGLKEMTTNCTTITLLSNGRRTSKQEVNCYQKLYGDLVKCVEHYKV